jgi:hypothetical protein
MSMWRELLKVIPQVDQSGLTKMENTLTNRFTSVAKKFGVGLAKAFSVAGVAALGVAVVDKLLNPIKETEDIIKRTLSQSADIVDNAKQFETTTGKLFKLQMLAKSRGLEEDSLKLMLGKFQVALAEERAKKPGELGGTLKAFVGQKDTAEAFFSFIQALQRLDKDQQVIIEKEIFGEKVVGRATEFLQTNFPEQMKAIGAKPAEYYNQPIESASQISDLQNALQVRTEMEDFIKKGKTITPKMVRSMNQSEEIRLQKENERLASYENIKRAAIAGEQVAQKLDEMSLNLSKQIPAAIEVGSKIENGVYTVIDSVLQGVQKLGEVKNTRGLRLGEPK